MPRGLHVLTAYRSLLTATVYRLPFTATTYTYLDQLGAELEGPFGTDDNDFPLLHMGLALMDNMDSLLRILRNQRLQGQVTKEKAQRSVTRRAHIAARTSFFTAEDRTESHTSDAPVSV